MTENIYYPQSLKYLLSSSLQRVFWPQFSKPSLCYFKSVPHRHNLSLGTFCHIVKGSLFLAPSPKRFSPPHPTSTLQLSKAPFPGAIIRKPAFWSLLATVHFLHQGPPQGEVAREKRKILGFPTLFKSQGPLAQVIREFFFSLSEF